MSIHDIHEIIWDDFKSFIVHGWLKRAREGKLYKAYLQLAVKFMEFYRKSNETE